MRDDLALVADALFVRALIAAGSLALCAPVVRPEYLAALGWGFVAAVVVALAASILCALRWWSVDLTRDPTLAGHADGHTDRHEDDTGQARADYNRTTRSGGAA